MSGFVHLNVHSEYSPMEAVPSLESLCQAARDRGFETLALTDTNGLYGVVRFLEIAKKFALKPIVGAEVTDKQSRALVLVKTQEGYANLCRILSACHESADFDLATGIARFRSGAIVISDSHEVVTALKRDSTEDLYIEITPGPNIGQFSQLSRTTGLPPVATNAVRLLNPQDFHVYRLLQAIQHNTTLSRLPRSVRVLPRHWLVPGRLIEREFAHLPEALANTRKIAEACTNGLDFSKSIFPDFGGLGDRQAFIDLRQKAYAGASHRYRKLTTEVRERLEHELRIIDKKNYAHYFLIVHDITAKAPITCGRGSGASSLVSYCLGITHVDPIKHRLVFDRFLNAERDDPPDIDIDFPWDERERLLSGIFSQYGRERVAMVANHNRLGIASAIREVAKVYGIPATEITRFAARIVRQQEVISLCESPQSRAWAESVCRSLRLEQPWPEILGLAQKIEGHFRNLSMHCGGLVIVPDEIRKYTAVERAANGMPVLQWDKEQVEEAGLIKIDLLGNRSLSVIRDTLSAVAKKSGQTVWQYQHWDPTGDEATKAMIRAGETIGCFNIESPAVRLLLRKLWLKMPAERKSVLDVFHYLIMVSSLVRPAAISFVADFIRRAHSGESQPLDARLKETLEETHGILLYQEDVTRVAMALAGFSLENADQLRKALNKKRKAKALKAYRDDFYRGALERGVSPATIEKLWSMILSFAGYGFCKAHSASYAQVSFKCAYLKAHYPAEFMAAVLSNEGGYYPALAYISEARRMGLEITAPDINESAWHYEACGRAIRAGFMVIKGIKKQFINQVIADRAAKGPFTSFGDFCSRIDPELEQSRLLIKSGCFDSIVADLTRPGMLWQTHAHRNPNPPAQLPNPPEYSKQKKLAHEIECFGFVLSCHPIDLYEVHVDGANFIQAADIEKHIGEHVSILGWMVSEKLTQTKKGEPMEFVTFEDRSAIYEATFFPDVYRRLWQLVAPNHLYLLDGVVEQDFGVPTLNVKQLKSSRSASRRLVR